MLSNLVDKKEAGQSSLQMLLVSQIFVSVDTKQDSPFCRYYQLAKFMSVADME